MANPPGHGTDDGAFARMIDERIAALNTRYKDTLERKWYHRAEEAKWIKARLRTLNTSTSAAKNC